MSTIKLYHGTASTHFHSITESGLKPSYDGFVYLGREKAILYAANRSSYSEGMIIGVKVNTDNLYPDPDYLISVNMSTSVYSQKKNKHLWSDSLKRFGQVAHLGTINTEKFVTCTAANYDFMKPILKPIIPKACMFLFQSDGNAKADWKAQRQLIKVCKPAFKAAAHRE